MMMETAFVLPILTCLLTCAGLGVCIGLFVSAKAEMRRLGSNAVRKEELALQIEEIKTNISAVRDVQSNLEKTKSLYTDWISETGSVHLNQEGQVLRLYRRGTSIPEIATVLRLPAGEVRLIVKVHELSRSFPMAEKSNEDLPLLAKAVDTGGGDV